MKVAIIGAGAIGCFVGVSLLRVGVDVTFVGRQSLLDDIKRTGRLHISDHNDEEFSVPADKVKFVVDLGELPRDFDFLLITVKHKDTEEVARKIAAVFDGVNNPPVVVSLQNGVSNYAVLRQHLPSFKILKGMVGFGVRSQGNASFYRGTTNPLDIEEDVEHHTEKPLLEALNSSGIAATATRNIDRMQYGKLLININNSIVALVDLPLQKEFTIPSCRRILAAAIEEGLAVYEAHGIVAGTVGRLNPYLMQYVLRLPNFILSRFQSSMVKLKGDVYSSMWEDLHNKRPTEIDILNGEISRLGRQKNIPTPINDRLAELIQKHEREQTIPKYDPEELENIVLKGTSSYVIARLQIQLLLICILFLLMLL